MYVCVRVWAFGLLLVLRCGFSRALRANLISIYALRMCDVTTFVIQFTIKNI